MLQMVVEDLARVTADSLNTLAGRRAGTVSRSVETFGRA